MTPLFALFFYTMLSLMIVLPAVAGLFLMIVPRQKILAKYQDFALGRTRRSLKDEDFLYLNKWAPYVKFFGIILICVSVAILTLVIL